MTAQTIGIKQIAGRIGAEIYDVKLGGDLDAETVAAIRAAILTHKVVFFRGQEHLDDEEHQRFAALLGPLVGHPTATYADAGGNVISIDAADGVRANQWHTDVTFTDAPPAFSVLRAVTLPPYGGDTQWANTVAAYDELSAPLQQLADQLWARHSNQYDYVNAAELAADENARKNVEATRATPFSADHPVVHVHPETGERAIALGAFVGAINDVSSEDSRHLFDLLQSHVTRSENTVRWQWTLGDVAIWDNRATQHYALYDYAGQPRRVHRVTVSGAPLVSVDGRTSAVVDGRSWA